MSAVITRILLRYAAGALVAHGLLASDVGNQLAMDPDVLAALEVGVGAILMAISEGWYYLARRFGWSK